MTSSWISKSTDLSYIEALKSTNSLGEPSEGFIRATDSFTTNKGIQCIIKQNNLLIDLIIQLHQKVDDISQRIGKEGLKALPFTASPEGSDQSDRAVRLAKELSAIQNSLQNLSFAKTSGPIIPKPVHKF
ncbi:hypothetical protein VNO77_23322 [Canavalia gladiata]|uniref:Uncharacterized protein n=1 Tax=Canavalia gladiata TaxID=3824 RepID=A0AAN9L4B3_CANGL